MPFYQKLAERAEMLFRNFRNFFVMSLIKKVLLFSPAGARVYRKQHQNWWELRELREFCRKSVLSYWFCLVPEL